MRYRMARPSWYHALGRRMAFLHNRIIRSGLGVVALLLAYLLFWPVPIRPYAWTPDPDPGQTGPYVANDDLARAHLIPVGVVPEDAAPETLARNPADGR